MATTTIRATAPKEARYFYAIATPDENDGEILHSACETFDDAEIFYRPNDTIRHCRFEPLETKQRFRIAHMLWGSKPGECPAPRSPLDIPSRGSIYRGRIHDDHELLDRAAGLTEVGRRNRANLDAQDESFYFRWFVLIELGKSLPGSLIGLNVSMDRVGCETRTQSFPVRIVVPTEDEIWKERTAHRFEIMNQPLGRPVKRPAVKRPAVRRKAR